MPDFRTLPVALTDEELLLAGDEAARLERDITLAEDALRAETKERKDAIAADKDRLKALLQVVREKRRDRRIEVHTAFNYKARMAEVVRLDTGEVVGRRTLTEEEIQGHLFEVTKGSKFHGVLNTVTDAVNAGAIDSDGVTVRAEKK